MVHTILCNIAEDEEARWLNAKSIMMEISPAGFQSLQVVLEEELLIMKLLVSTLRAEPAW